MKATILGALLLLAVINLSTAKSACILWDKDGNAGCVVEGEIEENVRNNIDVNILTIHTIFPFRTLCCAVWLQLTHISSQ